VPFPRRASSKREEQAFHIEARRFLDLVLPSTALSLHVPNEGKRSLILYDRRAFCMEFKSDDGALDIDQRACHAQLRTAGIPVEVVRCFEEIIARLHEWGIPLKRNVEFQNAAYQRFVDKCVEAGATVHA